MSGTLRWKLNRLRAMSAAEVGWRLRQAFTGRLERMGIGLASEVPVDTGTCGAPWISPWPAGFHANTYVEAADRIIAGKWSLFSLQNGHLGFPPRWNRDPKSGIEVPLHFGQDIDYRNEHIAGDIKYLWELNRHLELVTLAQAWQLTREPRLADASRRLLLSWLEQCPYPRGPNWTSSLELAVRLVNWACAWQLLGGESSLLFAAENGPAFRRSWLVSVYQHCDFISRHLSRHSSANNHLFGELTGLFIASLTWPHWPESQRWREMARLELEAEALKQTAADGVNREQAFWYHHEVADMMLLCLLFARANRIEFSDQFKRRLELMLEFILAVMDVAGHVPMVGDADDAVMVRFSQEAGFCPYRSLLATGAMLFGRSDFKAPAQRFDDKSRWLLGDAAAIQFERMQGSPSDQARHEFPEGGYYIIGRDFGMPGEVKAVIDAGPLGYLAIAAHGHADALAFTLSIGGHEVLVDPGTYAYHAQPRWRDYFRGTAAHNTLRVDGLEQSVPGGNFMWLTHARARCTHFEVGTDRDVFEGLHDGYRRLDDPVLHRRRVEFDKNGMRLEVRDWLECAGEHSVNAHWHLSDACTVQCSSHSVEVECGNVRLRIGCPRELDAPKVVVGQKDPPLGWLSRRLDHKTPSPVIVCAGRIAGNTSLVTTFTIESRAIQPQS